MAIKESEGTALTSAWGTSLVYDGRNHPKNPTKGYYFQVGTDFAGLGGDVKYIRMTGEARFYYPITDKITFVGRAVGGHIMGWGGDDVRLIDLFYKGGETIRGFNRGGFGPRDLLHRRRAGRRHLLGDHGGGALPAAASSPRISAWAAPSSWMPARCSVRAPFAKKPDTVRMASVDSVWRTTRRSARRQASASCGTRRWDRCGSTSPRPS